MAAISIMNGFLNNYTNHFDALTEVEKDALFTYSWENRFMPDLRPPLTKKLYLTFVASDLISHNRKEEAERILFRGLELKLQPEDDYPIHNFLARFYDDDRIGYEKTKLYCETMLNYINHQNASVVYVGDFYPNYIYCRDKYFEIVIVKENQLEKYEELLELFKSKGLLPNTEKGIIALNRMKSIYHQTAFQIEFKNDLAKAEYHAREVGKFDEIFSSAYLKKLSKAFYSKSEFQKSAALLDDSIRLYPFVSGIAKLKQKLVSFFENFITEEEILNLKMQYIRQKEANILNHYDNKVISDLYKEIGMLDSSKAYYEKYKSPTIFKTVQPK